MKKYKVTREIQKFNKSARNINEVYLTTEKGTLKSFVHLEDAKKYLSELYKKAFQKARFESVTKGASQFRAHTADMVFIYKIV